ncbi:charged multivesicular body protein 7 [Cydia fagiglandana]|uniref:charged multivesicular body protein 7 n=1 Tax=Cydia fagiglandana TaxID=1458189 RepID=UPI002FEDF41B
MGLPDTCITEDKLPQCWSDDVRMNALFAPFRLKTANPESWDMKMKFWSDLLRQYCRWKKDPVVSAADLKCAFMRKGRTPACLDIVVEEMFRNGELAPLTKYQQILHNGPEGWVRWGARLAFKPAALALTAVTSLLPARQAIDSDGLPKASIDSTQRFVCESAVKEQATELLENFPNDAERIGTVDELMKICKWQQGRDTFEMLLGYLVAQGAAVKKDEVIKLAEPNKKATPVTETDEALVRLVAAEARLEAEAGKLAREASIAEGEARAALQLGNRLAAKNHLRRKHKLQQRIDHTDGALQNVKQLLQQMREVDTTSAIVDTYKVSSQALKRGMKEGGLDEDAVHDTMDDLKEVMEQYNEVEKALAGSAEDVDAAELEQELRELLSGPAAPPGGGERKEVPVPRTPQSKKNTEPDFVFDGEERVIAELNELSVEDASPRAPRTRVPVAEGWEPTPTGQTQASAELELSVEDASPMAPRTRVPVAEGWEPTPTGETGSRNLNAKPLRSHLKAGTRPALNASAPTPLGTTTRTGATTNYDWMTDYTPYPPSTECLRPNTTWNNNPDRSYDELRLDDRLHPGECSSHINPEASPKSSQSWYPPSTECLRPDTTWNNNPDRSYDELRLDDRLHPGECSSHINPEASPKSSQSWYPPSTECLRPDTTWNNNPDRSYDELRLDDRLHPGECSSHINPEASPKSSQSWYPPSTECLRPDTTWNKNPDRSYDELRLDDRLHPGQPFNIDFTMPAKLYSSDFQVRDHKPHSGVWLYNSRDDNCNTLNNSFSSSTQYTR